MTLSNTTNIHTILDLGIFGEAGVMTTGDDHPGRDMSPEMRDYYEKRLIDIASPKLVHDQFGDFYPVPKGNGRTVQFRRYSPLSKATKPLTEGVTPDGSALNVTAVTADVEQYGDWIGLSDMLDLTAIDNNVLQATRLLGNQAGRTLDSVTREVLAGGTNVRFAPKGQAQTEVTARADVTADCKVTPELIFRASADLAAMNADPIDDSYVAIVHPYVAYDLMRCDEWLDVHKYASPDAIYAGEIGKLGGVRFISTSEAKIIGPGEIGDGKSRLTVKTALTNGTALVINEVLTPATPAEAIPVYVAGTPNTVTAITTTNGVTTLTLGTAATVAKDALVCGAGAGKDGSAVFCTLVLGAHAYGTTEIEGGGLRHIVKQLGYGDDPLDQRSSCGWKATKAAQRLVEAYMVRLESGSAYSATAESN